MVATIEPGCSSAGSLARYMCRFCIVAADVAGTELWLHQVLRANEYPGAKAEALRGLGALAGHVQTPSSALNRLREIMLNGGSELASAAAEGLANAAGSRQLPVEAVFDLLSALDLFAAPGSDHAAADFDVTLASVIRAIVAGASEEALPFVVQALGSRLGSGHPARFRALAVVSELFQRRRLHSDHARYLGAQICQLVRSPYWESSVGNFGNLVAPALAVAWDAETAEAIFRHAAAAELHSADRLFEPLIEAGVRFVRGDDGTIRQTSVESLSSLSWP
jgi:hypothetical protein